MQLQKKNSGKSKTEINVGFCQYIDIIILSTFYDNIEVISRITTDFSHVHCIQNKSLPINGVGLIVLER